MQSKAPSTRRRIAVYVNNFLSYRRFVQMDLTFWERETAIVFKPGPSLDKPENGTFVFSYVQPIRIFM